MIIVPDASVILKWVLEKEDESDHDTAARLQQAWLDESVELHLPKLWLYEMDLTTYGLQVIFYPNAMDH